MAHYVNGGSFCIHNIIRINRKHNKQGIDNGKKKRIEFRYINGGTSAKQPFPDGEGKKG